MSERRHRVGSESRSLLPRRPTPRSRDFGHSRRRKLSPYRRHGKEEYSGEAKTSRRIVKRDDLDRDSKTRAPRFSEYEDRDRDRNVVGGRRLRSPPKRDNFDRPVSFSDYGDGAKVKYEDGVSVAPSRTSYIEDLYRGDSRSSMKFQRDRLLGGPSESNHFGVKDYGFTRDSNGVGDTNVTSVGGERDYYRQNRYLDSCRAGLLSVPQYLDSTEPVSKKYESGVSMHSRSYTLAHGGVKDMPISNSGRGDGSSNLSSVASRYLNTDTDKQGYFHFRDELHLERRDGLHDRKDDYFGKKNDGSHFHDRFLDIGKTVERETYKFKKEDNIPSSRGYLSSSQPKDYDSVPSNIVSEGFLGYSATRDLHVPSDMIRRGSGLTSQPISFDGYIEKEPDIFSRGSGGQLDGTRNRSLHIGLPEERQGDLSYAEFGRSKIESMNTGINDVIEDYKRDQQMPRFDVLNHTVDERSHKKHMGDDGLLDQYPSFPMQSKLDKFDALGSLHERKQDLDILAAGSSRLNYEAEGYSGYGGVKPEEHHADVGGGHWSRFEGSDLLQSRGYDPSFGRHYGSPRKMSPLADLGLGDHSERRISDRPAKDEVFYEHDVGIRIYTDGNDARKIRNQVDDEFDPAHLPKKPKSNRSNYEKTWRTSNKMANDQPSSSKFHPRHTTKAPVSDSRDIKKRLGPLHQKPHVSQRLAKKYKPSIKKRLGPARKKKRATLPWLKTTSSNIVASYQNDSDGGPHDHDGHDLEDQLPLAKPEPPEKSEDFKQLVQSAFFKFLKQINETPSNRKKYTEQEKAGILKCIACGSKSDEFVGTERLAMHAFTSRKDGLRSQHLGLHKALCVLMGWKITEPGSEWHCEVMSDAETSALKEDLIIWPPAVIIHNSTIDFTSPDKRVIISTEELDRKLRDMGFGSIFKVCNGKPANQSVMLVKFNGTLSGLQEAEKFHQSYVESKHGRSELEQLRSENGISRGAIQVISTKREENFLYGYLGIAEDLDKLDFDTKKRCVLRSRKQILSIVDAA